MRLEDMAEMSNKEVHGVEKKPTRCARKRKVCFFSQTQQADRCAEKLEQFDVTVPQMFVHAVVKFVETPQIQVVDGSYPMLQVMTQQVATLIADMSEARTVQSGAEGTETRDVAH